MDRLDWYQLASWASIVAIDFFWRTDRVYDGALHDSVGG